MKPSVWQNFGCKTRPNFSSESPVNPRYNQVPTKNNLFWTGRTVHAIESPCIPMSILCMIQRFGQSVPEICVITSLVTDLLYDNHAHRVMQWNPYILSPENFQVYAEAIHEKGAPLKNCFGFINGTVRPICRPQQHQRIVYNGHKRVHSLKFQCVALPNGIIAHIFGPVAW